MGINLRDYIKNVNELFTYGEMEDIFKRAGYKMENDKTEFNIEKVKLAAEKLGLEIIIGADHPGIYDKNGEGYSWEELIESMSDVFPFLKDYDKE